MEEVLGSPHRNMGYRGISAAQNRAEHGFATISRRNHVGSQRLTAICSLYIAHRNRILHAVEFLVGTLLRD